MINSPTDISNCMLWLDASDTTTMYLSSEETRYNLIKNPINLEDNLVWKTTSHKVSAYFIPTTLTTQTTGPNGLSGVRMLSAASMAGQATPVRATTIVLEPSTNYTFSAFFKPDPSVLSLSSIKLEVRSFPSEADGASCVFILSGAGELSANTLREYGNATGSSATITLSANNWYFCELNVGTHNWTETTAASAKIAFPLNGKLYAYGAQVEKTDTRQGYLYKATVDPLSSQVSNNGDVVGFWKDKTSSDYRFYATSSTRRPTWVSSLSCLRFDGTNDFLISYFDKNYKTQSVFVVIGNHGTNGCIYSQVCGENSDVLYGHTFNNFVPLVISSSYYFSNYHGRAYNSVYNTATRAGTLGFYYGSYVTDIGLQTNSFKIINSFTGGTTDQGTGISINGVHTYTVEGAGQTSRWAYVDPTYKTNNVHTNPPEFAVNQTAIGAAFPISSYNKMDLCEVIVYDGDLTTQEKEDIHYYLTRKWNFLDLPRTIYPTADGNFEDPNIWNIVTEPSPYNIRRNNDIIFTNNKYLTASTDIEAHTIGGFSANFNIEEGGSILLLPTVASLSCYQIFGQKGKLAQSQVNVNTHTVIVSSSNLTLHSSDIRYEQAISVCPDSTVMVAPYTSVNHPNNLGYSTSPSSLGYFGVINLFDNSSLSAVHNSIALRSSYRLYQGRYGCAIALSGTNSTVVLNNLDLTLSNTNMVNSIIEVKAPGTLTLSACKANSSDTLSTYSYERDGNIVLAHTGSIFLYDTTLIGSFRNGNSTNTAPLLLYGNAKCYASNVTLSTIPASVTSSGSSMIRPAVWLRDNSSLQIWLSSGNVIPTPYTPAVFSTSTVPVSVHMSENIANYPNGTQTFCCNKLKILRVGTDPFYVKHGGKLDNTPVYFWTSDSILDYPNESDVVTGTPFSNASTGTAVLPPANVMYYGVPAGPPEDRYYGTATFDPDDLFAVPITLSLASDTIGERIKNTTTNQFLSAIVEGWSTPGK